MYKGNIKPIDLGNDINEITQQAVQGLKEDEKVYQELKKLKLSSSQVKNGLPAILDFQADFHVCENCQGLDKCPKAERGLQMILDVFDGSVRLSFDRCDKKKKFDAIRALFITCSFPIEWAMDDFKSINWTKQRKDALAKKWVDLEKESSGWIYLTGNHRSGKSYLLASIAYKYAKSHGPVAFCDTHALIDRLKDCAINNKTKFEKMFKTLCSCPLLVLDGFGSEYKSDYVFSNIIYPILAERSNADLPTCFSSNFKIKDIVSMYKVKIGDVMANEFGRLLKDMTGGETDVSGLAVDA